MLLGLMGNPSDGFNGKTLSLLIWNFYAEVKIVESGSSAVELIPHPQFDPTAFGAFDALYLNYSTKVQFPLRAI